LTDSTPLVITLLTFCQSAKGFARLWIAIWGDPEPASITHGAEEKGKMGFKTWLSLGLTLVVSAAMVGCNDSPPKNKSISSTTPPYNGSIANKGPTQPPAFPTGPTNSGQPIANSGYPYGTSNGSPYGASNNSPYGASNVNNGLPYNARPPLQPAGGYNPPYGSQPPSGGLNNLPPSSNPNINQSFPGSNVNMNTPPTSFNSNVPSGSGVGGAGSQFSPGTGGQQLPAGINSPANPNFGPPPSPNFPPLR
jgi:hypothetical protein